MISGIGIYYPDGIETQRVGIVPDIEVHPTIEGIRQGRDEVLETAFDCSLVGIREKTSLSNQVMVYPNPTSSVFTISFELKKEAVVMVSIINSKGIVVKKSNLGSLSAGKHEFEYNLANRPAGLYFYQVMLGERLYSGRIILLH